MNTQFASVPATYLDFLLQQAELAGCDLDEIFSSIQSSRAEVCLDGQCSAFLYGQLYQRIMRVVHDEWFAMFAGGKVPLGAFRLMCLVASQCHDLRQALVRCGEFAEICQGLQVRTLVNLHGDRAHLSLCGVRSLTAQEFELLQARVDANFITLSLLASHRFHCWLVGKDISIRHLKLSFGEHQTVFNIGDFGAEQVSTHCLSNELIYDLEALDFPVVQNQESALEFARTAPYHLITVDPDTLSITEKVRNLLNRDVGHGMPQAEEIANLLHVSTTTLRRHLMAENTSFRRLKDECRLEAALHYLSCPELTNAQIAEKLGFDEPSTFFRAFKKWTGETPGNYRLRLLS